jgi:putative colanic acid biosysnthesis UDP-glucose lipid carrier transferase
MLWGLMGGHALLGARPSVVSLASMLLWPIVILGSLIAATVYFAVPLDGRYAILSFIVFSLCFPGTSKLNERFVDVVRDVVGGWTILAALLLFLGYISGYLNAFPKQVLVAWIVVTPVALILVDQVMRQIIPRFLALENQHRDAVIVGMNEIGLQLARQFHNNRYLGVRVVGFFDDRGISRLVDTDTGGHTFFGPVSALGDFARQNRAEIIFIALPMAKHPRILRILDDLGNTTVSIYFVPDVFITNRIQGLTDNIDGIPIVAVCETPFTGINSLIKRLSDIALAALILALVSPLMLVIAAGVKFSSPGPVMFSQRRYGLNGEEIVVYKFRTMRVCEDGEHVEQAMKNDRRTTPFGTFLRRTSLDELPQFFNVLQGRMSVVGPRPHAVAHNEMYRKLIKGYMIRHKVKPGITGLAQVKGMRGETDTVEKMKARIEYDLHYLRNWSLRLDLYIVAKTVWVVLTRKNAY